VASPSDITLRLTTPYRPKDATSDWESTRKKSKKDNHKGGFWITAKDETPAAPVGIIAVICVERKYKNNRSKQYMDNNRKRSTSLVGLIKRITTPSKSQKEKP